MQAQVVLPFGSKQFALIAKDYAIGKSAPPLAFTPSNH